MLEAVREHVWRPIADAALTRIWFPDHPEAEQAEWAYVVEAGLEPVVLALEWGNEAQPFEVGAFADHLRLNRFDVDGPDSLWRAAAVLSWFEIQCLAPERLPLNRSPLSADVDAILRESDGVVMWNHQVERLSVLGGVASGEALAFRAALAKRARWAWDWADELDLGDGVTLAAALTGRSPVAKTLTVPLDLVRALYLRDALRSWS